MNLLGKEAVDVARHYKARLPKFSLEDLKLLQITLGQELCLSAAEGEFAKQHVPPWKISSRMPL